MREVVGDHGSLTDPLALLPTHSQKPRLRPKPSHHWRLWPGLTFSKAGAASGQAKAVAFRPSRAGTSLLELDILSCSVGLMTGSGTFLAGSAAFSAVIPDSLRTGTLVHKGREALEWAEEDLSFIRFHLGKERKGTDRSLIG